MRIGQYGKPFTIFKLRTIKEIKGGERLITKLGHFLRKTKLDETPQVFNVLRGDMSLVGPRPDVPGFADKLQGDDKIILSVKPGLTGLATLYFRNEEELIAKQKKPEDYNRNIIWPKKVKLNRAYINNYSFSNDLRILFRTVFNL